ncbi:competence protein ComGD [Gracilibacillus ureilyticus]|uniref:Competence protein ComGD n=2 Tax=Gracilibacillus ureilyticus TaxID=531814 RepID=A0A1H9LYZ2_9BACI|nr:competence protein ComGD [Gracilibacillus ureilyticus]
MIEIIIVLSIAGTLFLLGRSFTVSTIDHQQFRHFLNQFNQDLLYLQQLNLTSASSYSLNFELDKNKYHIRSTGRGKIILSRDYPEDWIVDPNTLKLPINFSHEGTLKQPGTLKVKTSYSTHFITCPFGKGRCYSAK